MSENKRIANTRLREGERIDELQRNGYVIIQDPKRFCFGMDAVLLSGFAHVKAGERVLDSGQALFRFCGKRKQTEAILRDLRFSRKARIWQEGVSG